MCVCLDPPPPPFILAENVFCDHTYYFSSSGDGSEIQDYLLKLTGGRSVPRVFIGGKFVGGGTDIKELHQKGTLKTLLKEAGAL